MAAQTSKGESTKQLRRIHIDAEAKKPNTFWVSDSGKYYRKYSDAVEDITKRAVDPQDYVKEKKFLDQNRKTLLVCGLILAFGLVAVYLFDKGKLVLNGNKW